VKKLFSLLLFLPVIAFSQSGIDPVQVVQFSNYCAPYKVIEQYIDQFDELPLLRGRSIRNAGTVPVEHVMIFYFNKTTKTWTAVERVGDDLFCIIGNGVGSELVPLEIIRDVEKGRLKKRS
jgi:hypothetical protein